MISKYNQIDLYAKLNLRNGKRLVMHLNAI